jgi:hypothetical protein
LIGPIAANCTRAKPFPIHRAQSLLGILTFAERNEPIASRATCLHVPHNASFRNGTECGESLEEDFVIDFVREITNEDVEVIRGVFFVGGVGLVRPVNTDFLRCN